MAFQLHGRRTAQLTIATLAAALFAALLMELKQDSSRFIGKLAFSEILRRMHERYTIVQVTVTTHRVTESRHKVFAELKSPVRGYFHPEQVLVRYSYIEGGKQFIVETDERAGTIFAVRVCCEQSSDDICNWLVSELRKVSPTLLIKVHRGKGNWPTDGGDKQSL